MLSPTARAALEELRHGPLDHYELAAELDAAPFTVRGELRALARRRPPLVRMGGIGRAAERWELTTAGAELVDSLQLRLEL